MNSIIKAKLSQGNSRLDKRDLKINKWQGIRIWFPVFLLLMLVGCKGENNRIIKAETAVTIIFRLEGYSPEDAEHYIVIPVEKQLASIQGASSISSHATNSFAQIDVVFESHIEPVIARSRVKEAIDAVKPDLPAEMLPPEIIASPLDDTVEIRLFHHSPEQRRVAGEQIIRALEADDIANDFQFLPEKNHAVQVKVKREEARMLGISTYEISQVIRTAFFSDLQQFDTTAEEQDSLVSGVESHYITYPGVNSDHKSVGGYGDLDDLKAEVIHFRSRERGEMIIVPLGQICDFEIVDEWDRVIFDGKHASLIRFSGKDIPKRKLLKVLEEAPLPDSVEYQVLWPQG